MTLKKIIRWRRSRRTGDTAAASTTPTAGRKAWWRRRPEQIGLTTIGAVAVIVALAAGATYATINLTAQKPAEHASLKSGIKLAQGGKGLIGWWKLNGNTKDSTPYGNNGTNIGGATSTTDRKGTANGAYSFNGSQYVNVPNYTQLDPGTNSLSISLWIKTSGTAEDLVGTANNNLGNYTTGYDLAVAGNWGVCGAVSGGLLFSITTDGTVRYSICSTATVNDNQWHHIVVVVNRSANTKSLYIDGVLNKTTANTPTGSITNSRFSIGQSLFGSDFNGSIGDVRIYSRALSQSDVTNLYNSYNSQINLYSPPGSGSGVNLTAGLIGYWPFSGNAKDATPYHNDGTVSGATLTAGRSGAPNTAYSLNGTTNSIATSAADLPQHAITVAAWVNMSSFPAPPPIGERVVNNQWVNANGSWLMFIWDGGTGPYATFGINPSGTTQYNASCNAGSFTLNSWHFLVGTYDGSTIRLYQDGATCHISNLSGQTLSTSGSFQIASVTGVQGTPEKIDDVRIYNRALSAAEVQALYNLPD